MTAKLYRFEDYPAKRSEPYRDSAEYETRDHSALVIVLPVIRVERYDRPPKGEGNGKARSRRKTLPKA
jgi:hypothetical protein